MSHYLRRFISPTRSLSAFLIACLLTLLVAAPAARAETILLFTEPGSGTWIVPEGVTSITIECWGGGGGGGTDPAAASGGAGGGGGGAYARVNTFAVTPGASYDYVVGAGGGSGVAGEDSSFNGTTCVAAGGAGGASANSGAGGAGGTASVPTTGDVTFAGGTGSNGVDPVLGASFGGGGGGSAGTGSNGNSVIDSNIGAAAVEGGGPGGNGTTNSNGGAPVSGPGGGGGGGEATSTGASIGGSGFAGQIRITYKLTPVLSVTNSPVTYDGTAQAAVVASSVPGTVSNVLYNGSPTVPTDAGTYTVTADFVPDDTATYDSLTGAAAGTFVIDKAATTTTVTCSAGPFTYTGAAIEPCTAAVTGPGGLNQALAVTYVDNTNAGTATASASYAESANHLASSDSETFTIGKAATTTTVTCSAGPFTYTGSPIEPCTASVTGPGGLNQALAVTYANNTNAGTATASASYAGSANHLASNDSETFVIGEATTAVELHLPYVSK